MELIEKKEHKEYASKGLAGTALGFGIGGAALALMNSGFKLFNNNSNHNSESNSCNLTCKDKVELTSAIYQGRITELQERFEDRNKIDREIFGVYKNQIDSDFSLYKGFRDGIDGVIAKHNADSFALYKNQRDSFDILSKRINDLEVKQATEDAISPYRQQLLQMQINNVAQSSQAAIELEAERRCCADNKIVNYSNNTFYPIQVADVTVGTTSTTRTTYNPLCGCCNVRMF